LGLARGELLKIGQVPPHCAWPPSVGPASARVPIAAQHVFAREERADAGSAGPGLALTVAHNVQQGPQGRTSLGDTPVVEVELRDALLRADDVVHAVGKRGRSCSAAGAFLREDHMRMVEHPSAERIQSGW